MTQLKKLNRRAHKTINKKYRFHKVDFWGRLANSSKDKKITRIVSNHARQTLFRLLKQYPKPLAKYIKKHIIFIRSKRQQFFKYQINTKAMKRRRQKRSFRNKLLKIRRQFSLFYGGGRIRSKSFRRYRKMAQLKSKTNFSIIDNQRIFYYNSKDDFVKLLESRSIPYSFVQGSSTVLYCKTINFSS